MPAPVILYLRCDSIGDHVLSAGMLQPLRQAFPDANLIAVVPDAVAPVYERCPHITELIAIPFARFSNPAFREGVARQIRDLKADLCLSPVYSRTELADYLVAASNARERIGHAGDMRRIPPHRRDPNNKFYTRLIPSTEAWKPELARHTDFLTGMGIRFDPAQIRPTMWTSPADDEFAAAVFNEHKFDPQKTIALFAGAQLGVRKYNHYGKAIAAECRSRKLKIIALGGPEDSAINSANLIDAGVESINLSGKTTLRQAAAILQRCKLAIGAETGLAHIACAMNTPNVILLGGGHFGRFMPYSPLTTVACLPLNCFGCDWECKFNRVHCTWDLNPAVLSTAFAHALNHPPAQHIRIFCQDPHSWKVDRSTTPEWTWPAKLIGQIPLEIRQVPIPH